MKYLREMLAAMWYYAWPACVGLLALATAMVFFIIRGH